MRRVKVATMENSGVEQPRRRSILTLALDGVSCQLQAPAVLPPMKEGQKIAEKEARWPQSRSELFIENSLAPCR